MGRNIQKHPPPLKENNIFLVLEGLHQLDQIQIIIWSGLGNGKKNNPTIQQKTTDRTGPNVNFLLAAAFHMLCLADDLTLHVTCGDIAHSCRRIVSGLRALSAYSSQIGVRTEADLLTRH